MAIIGRKKDVASEERLRPNLSSIVTPIVIAGTSIVAAGDVARRLGCTKGRIHHYYATKTDLFFNVHRKGMARLFMAVEPARCSKGSGCKCSRPC